MITHKGTQTIKTDRLILRKIYSCDAKAVFALMSDPEVLKYEDWDVHTSVDYTCGFISYLTGDYKSEQTYCWGIQSGENLIGFIMAAGIKDWDCILAYYLKKDCWSKGYVTEAAKAVINYMFTEAGVGRISAKHSVKNIASGKVLQKVGMIFKGHVDEYEYYSSKLEWQDCDFYAITKEQYFNNYR